jgi:hypothetical protein
MTLAWPLKLDHCPTPNMSSFSFHPIAERRSADGVREVREAFLQHITVCRPEIAAYPTGGAEYRSVGIYGEIRSNPAPTLEEMQAEIREGEAQLQRGYMQELAREEEEIRRSCRRTPVTTEEVRREIRQEEAELQVKRRRYLLQSEREIRRQMRRTQSQVREEHRMSQDPRYMSYEDLKDAAARLVKGANDVIAGMYYERIAEEIRGNRGQRDFPQTLAQAKFERDMQLEEGPGLGRSRAREIAKAMGSPYIKGHRMEVDRDPK